MLNNDVKINLRDARSYVMASEYLLWLHEFTKKNICFDTGETDNLTDENDISNTATLKHIVAQIKNECKSKGIITERECSNSIQFITARFASSNLDSYIIQISFLDEAENEYFCVSYIDPRYSLDCSEAVNIVLK